ncbi:MAG TPA: hypothetical protein VMU42_12705 [Candidatus Sulfotelmatobacter sp.]|nr:hypothetical protein [Candidatus Sulfotelmatobacter sp.]
MQYVCDAGGGRTWFRIETEVEAAAEAGLMRHKVDKYFLQEKEAALRTYQPTSSVYIEQEIGLKAHLSRSMPMFLTLRDNEGKGLATAMLPPQGHDDGTARIVIVGEANSDPYPAQGDAITALGKHFGISLERERCFPYRHDY